MLALKEIHYGVCTRRKQEVMGLELVRMDWPLLKGGRETGTDAERFAIFLRLLNVCLSLLIMSGDTNLPIYIPIHLFSLYIYRMPTTCLLWTTCDKRDGQVSLSRPSGTSLWWCFWRLLNRLGRDIISVTYTSRPQYTLHWEITLLLLFISNNPPLHFQSPFLRGYTCALVIE